MKDYVNLATPVSRPYAETTREFAKYIDMSVSQLLQSGIKALASYRLKEAYADVMGCRERIAGLRAYLANDTWRTLHEQSPGVFPATRGEWEARIAHLEAREKTLDRTVKELDALYRRLGGVMFYEG